MPELTIIVTTYNIEDYVQECLRSIAQQTVKDFEVLVVDDGSTDSTPEHITTFAASDRRFTPVLLQENTPGGVATAANAGLDRARGTWIGFVDGDDYIAPGMFAELLKAAQSQSADLAMCQYREVVDGTEESRAPADAHRWGELPGRHYALDAQSTKEFLRFIAVPWRKLYRRSLVARSGLRFPVGDHFYEDNPFHWFSLVSAHSIALVPHVLYYHRIGRAGQTMAVADRKLLKIFQHHDTIKEWLAHQGRLETYGVTLLGWVISQLEWISQRTPQHLREELFAAVAPIFAQYTRTQVDAALREGKKGLRAQQLTNALTRQRRRRFLTALNGRPDSNSQIRLGLYHLRHSGVRRTLEMTSEVLGHKLASSPLRRTIPGRAASAASRAVHGAAPGAGQSDVLFGLVVLQEQVSRLEAKVDALTKPNAATTAQVRDDHAPLPPTRSLSL